MTAALPPGPKNAVWQMLQYVRNPEEWILDLGKRYGELFTSPTLMGPLVVASAPETIKAIFGADPDTFAPFGLEMMKPVLGAGSMLLQYGAPHKRARRLLQPPFHGARMRAYGTEMREVARRKLGATRPGKPFAIEPVFREISIEVIIRTCFGADAGERVENYRRGTLEAIASFGPLLGTFPFLRREFGGLGPWAKFMRRLASVHEMLREEIRDRRAAPGGREDILTLLVGARDEDGAAMEDREILEQMFTLVIAGHETTATAMAWAIYEIHRDADLLAQLKAEAAACGDDPDQLATAPLLEAVCSETLRRHPLIPMVSRRVLKPFSIGGYDLPEGTGLGACLLLAQMNPATYPEPEKFRPSRFLDGAPKISGFEYFPFGGGTRRCLGAAFASYEMKIVLGTILREFDLELASTAPVKTEARQATVGPKGGIPVLRRGN